MKQRCGIYGGSFNPIHNGHTKIATSLVNSRLVDELWLVVSPLNPLKQNSGNLLSDEARLSLARMAVGETERLMVSDIEMRLPRPSYMVRTLRILHEAYPSKEFVLVIGADNWRRFPEWYMAEEILAHHSIIVYPRRGCDVDKASLPPNVKLADTPLIDISSTEIRHEIACGAYDGEGLAPRVWEEIQRRGYYKNKER